VGNRKHRKGYVPGGDLASAGECDLRGPPEARYGTTRPRLVRGGGSTLTACHDIERRGLYEVIREERWGERRTLPLRAYPAR